MKYWSWYCKQNDVGTDLLPQDQSQNVSIQAQKFLTRWWWKGLSWPPNLSDQFLVNLVKLGFSSQKCTTLGGQIQPLSGDHLLCPPFAWTTTMLRSCFTISIVSMEWFNCDRSSNVCNHVLIYTLDTNVFVVQPYFLKSFHLWSTHLLKMCVCKWGWEWGRWQLGV